VAHNVLLSTIVLLGLQTAAWGQANPTQPTLPRSVPPSAQPAVTGTVVAVHDSGNVATNGTNLQTAYNAAACGSQIVLDAGVEYRANFVFNKQCSAASWIQVVSANLASIPITTYATPAQANNQNSAPAAPNRANLAKLTSGNGAPVLGCTSSGNVPAHYNYFAGLEITNTVATGLVWCTNSLTETLASQFPDHLVFDRLYVHGITASTTQFFTRGFLLTGSNMAVVNSYVSDIYSTIQDTQAILLAYGPGPYLIHNNFLEGAGENIMAGGTGATPGYSCTTAASPAPTKTTATVSNCTDGSGASIASPPIGTCVMFYTSTTAPAYTPDDWTCITANSSGTLTFNPIPSAPISGAAKVKWGIVPSDITITQNVMYKPLTWNPAYSGWDGITRTVKNLLETKYGARWLIDGNIFQHVWNGGQGVGFNLNANDQNGDCPWCTVQDITMTNNIWQDLYQTGVFIPAQSYTGLAPGALARVLVKNNLFWPQKSGTIFGVADYIIQGGAISPAGMRNGVDSLQIIHNHMLGPGGNFHVGSSIGNGIPENYSNLVIKDNLTEFDQYRWTNQCLAGADGSACINSTLNIGNTSTIANNAIVNTGAVNGDQGVSDAILVSRYGSLILSTIVDSYSAAAFVNYAAINIDYHNFALAAAAPFHALASDGTDPGVNFAQLDAAMGGSSGLTCDLNRDGVYNVLDVQLMTNQVLGLGACTNDLDGSSTCTIIDVQRVVNAALGASCLLGP